MVEKMVNTAIGVKVMEKMVRMATVDEAMRVMHKEIVGEDSEEDSNGGI